MYRESFASPAGLLTVYATETAVTAVRPAAGEADCPNTLTAACIRQLQEYFSGVRQDFRLPLSPCGSEFQLRVWAALQQIPYGHACTYGELAAQIGCRSARAVGQAVGRNPLLILIPCHRVLAAGHRLGGFSAGLSTKIILLNTEKITVFK